MTYRPKFVAQYDDPSTTLDWLNCTMASGAMGLDYDTLGHVQVLGGTLRSHSGDSVGGTGFGDPGLTRSWAHYGQTLHVGTGGHWDDVMAALKSGRNVVLQGMYGSLPKAYRSPLNSLTFTGPHAVDLNPEFNAMGDILMGDPLNNKWVWVPQIVLSRFAEALGYREYGATSPQKIFFAASDAHVAAPAVIDPVPYVHLVEVTATTVNIREQATAASPDRGDFKRGSKIKTTQLRRHGGRYTINGVVRTDWIGFNHDGETDWVARGYTRVI